MEERRRKKAETELREVRRELRIAREQLARAELPVVELQAAWIEDVVLN